MSIKDAIKEIEAASEEMLVPEHEKHHEGKLSKVVGELVKETGDAAEAMLGNAHEGHFGEVVSELVKETGEAAEQMIGEGLHKGHPDKIQELVHEIEDAADEMLDKK